jgi:hypothetical protein
VAPAEAPVTEAPPPIEGNYVENSYTSFMVL